MLKFLLGLTPITTLVFGDIYLSETVEKIQQPRFKVIAKKEEGSSSLSYGYRHSSTDLKSSFSGQAYYKMPLQKTRSPSTFVTAGAKIHNSSIKIKELKSEDEQRAMAQLGFNKEISSSHDQRLIRLEIAQPLYDNKNDFYPVIEMLYDWKF